MKVDFAFEQPLDEIVTEVLRMETILESEQAELMAAIGKEIKKEVRNVLPKSNEDAKHMRDDIKVTVQGKKAKTGITGVTVHGGKETAFKWHLLDDGTRNPDGSVHTPALHFTSKAMQAATPRIEQLINDLERSVTK
jgi:HK97 gp10 family phage protein